VPDIVLTTFNARYAHAAFGLRYLFANLGELRSRAVILEFDISQKPVDVVERILADRPRVVGIGVYIWNAAVAGEVVGMLKRVAPEVIVVLGGPEVSHETQEQAIVAAADYVITGEGDVAFAALCGELLGCEEDVKEGVKCGVKSGGKVIAAGLPRFEGDAAIALPYEYYTDEDLRNRVVYVEASRGCPFSCEFCLSSLEVPVRNVPLDKFLEAMAGLLDRGLRQFKFVDRTFNLNLEFSRSILQFFLDRVEPGMFLHFEMIPDRLPEALRELIRQFPPGALQFEVGVQTLDDATARRISRRQDVKKLAENLRFLRDETGVHVHADLIAGLPGEDLASFGRGFDRLLAMRPQEIQVGILKRLRGTPIVRHDAEWGMVYSPHPPYEVLTTKVIDFATMQRIRRFSRYWDLVANSGNFIQSTSMIWGDGSPFESFLAFSDWLFAQFGHTHGIALTQLAEKLFRFLVDVRKLPEQSAAETIWQDYQRGGRSDRPAFLAGLVVPADTRAGRPSRTGIPARQARHLTSMS
jgi:radical SAM superfamily enzyme YgiQ (UPF0313 family)